MDIKNSILDFLSDPWLSLLTLISILLVGLGLYYITGENNPYRKSKTKAIVVPRGSQVVFYSNIVEADYKIKEVSREPLSKEEEVK